jgi:hypothetical protein
MQVRIVLNRHQPPPAWRDRKIRRLASVARIFPPDQDDPRAYTDSYTIMAGLDPAISSRTRAAMDGRDKPGHDGRNER